MQCSRNVAAWFVRSQTRWRMAWGRQHGGRQGEGEDDGAGGMTGGRGLGAAATSLWSHNDERIADPQALLRQPMHASMLEPGGLAQYAATGILRKRKQTS